ncbi:hypothetical protein ElyMa_003000800 [Elysia marginata]|uniref:Uncharacterized protein n=1 Tax=Elysia marginata TaxID=1093978 RepID=A0AAV4IBS0_9GAST|nr:hypothetical protein ElyMa_003000800 [Elysia marginata]
MDSLIAKAKFLHDNEEEHDRFKEELDEWYSNNEENFSAADALKAIKALGSVLTGKTAPSHDTEGWKQAVTAYENVLKMTIDLKDAGKMKEKDIQEAYYNFILQISSNNVASIHMHIIKEIINESDISFEDYVKVIEKRNKICL